MSNCWYFFFFFQAEDGIRDLYVTGVQTCALPICDLQRVAHDEDHRLATADRRAPEGQQQARARVLPDPGAAGVHLIEDAPRSEERRVGKECRSGWWRDHEKKRESDTQVSS